MKATMTALLAGAMLSVGAMSAPALAANSGNNDAQQSQSMSKAHQNNPNYHGEFVGEVIGARPATFANGKKYMLVKIRSKKGDVAVLNLGPVKNLKGNAKDLQEGEYISASGLSGRINGKPVLVVYRLRVMSSDKGQNGGNGQNGDNGQNGGNGQNAKQ